MKTLVLSLKLCKKKNITWMYMFGTVFDIIFTWCSTCWSCKLGTYEDEYQWYTTTEW